MISSVPRPMYMGTLYPAADEKTRGLRRTARGLYSTATPAGAPPGHAPGA